MNGGKGFRAPGAGSFPGVQRSRRRNGGKLRFSYSRNGKREQGGLLRRPPCVPGSMFHAPFAPYSRKGWKGKNSIIGIILNNASQRTKKFSFEFESLASEKIGLCNYRFMCYDC